MRIVLEYGKEIKIYKFLILNLYMNIIVLGDIILDIYYFSKIERVAPEASNIPIHNIHDVSYILGGAANVAQNLFNLDANVELISIIGNDFYGEKIINLLNQKSIKYKLFIDETRDTTQKNRIYFNNSLTTRYDIENTHEISSAIENDIFNYILLIKKIDAIVISDYNKGCISESLIKNIIKYANENYIYTFVDPKINNYLKYQNCFCFKPNLIEATQISKTNYIYETIHFIKENIKCKNIVITCGKDGIILNNVENAIKHENDITDVVDVTGCGDIVMALIVYNFILTKDLLHACKMANYIAGISTRTIGNYVVSNEDINNYYMYKNTKNTNIEIENTKNLENTNIDKIIYDFEIIKIEQISEHKNIVFTNGCFDILHSAHIQLLQYSKKQGDILVVGLNSDESIKRLKGSERPINNLVERTTILSLFDFIDYVVVFDEDTPFNIIKLLKPDIIIKGSDYSIKDVVGKEFCKEVKLFDYIQNKSTSSIIRKIKNNNN